ncbi:hypothetical protein [Blastomonas sp. AAP53]|uniref:hypothetical protein n=1 Tax=Blastomonas sp. AAP53 TaxID=1248760 RepID=UPI000476F1A6|nr:hypothetical protein [Blastomonas sp. AAP53]
MKTRSFRAATLATILAAGALTVPAVAQQAATPEAQAADSGSMEPSPVTQNPSTAEEQAEREAANAAQAQMSSAQVAQNVANLANYEARRSSYESQMKLYENTVESRARAEAEYAEVKKLYDAIHAQWEADVAACTAGNRKRCAQSPVLPQ